MRILLVNWQDRTNPQAGGAEVHLHEIFGRLAARGHEVHLLCSGYAGAPDSDVIDGIHVHRVSSRYGFALTGRRAFARLARRLRPDLVVEDVNKVPLYLPLIWKGPFVLLVPHLFGATAFRELPAPVALVVWAAERPMRSVYARAHAHAISRSTADDLFARGFRPEAVRVIYPGVDTVRFVPDPLVKRETDPTFLYVGRLKRYKQVDVAIRAMQFLQAAGIGARLWIAGTGDDRPRLEGIARKLGVWDRVSFFGYVSEERRLELYRRAWAVVLPSLKEGWGITNLEAAACGTPAAAANNSAIKESVLGGETGFLFRTGDAQELAARLGTLATQPALRERLGQQARAFAETFSWEKTAQETESHLAAAVNSPGGREA